MENTQDVELEQEVVAPKPGKKKRKKSDGGWDWSTTIILLVFGAFVMGGGYAIGRYVFEMSVWLSILAAPALFVLLGLVLVIADWLSLFD